MNHCLIIRRRPEAQRMVRWWILDGFANHASRNSFFFKANFEKKSRFSFSRSRCRRFPGAPWCPKTQEVFGLSPGIALWEGGRQNPSLKESPKTYQKMIFFTEKKGNAMLSWAMDTDPGVVNGGLEQQYLQERNKKKDSKGQEGGRKDLCFLSSKKLLYIKRNWPCFWLFHLRHIIQRLLMHYSSFILMLLWWMRFAACRIWSPN